MRRAVVLGRPLVAVLAGCLALTACSAGGQDADPPGGPATTDTSTASASPEPTEPPVRRTTLLAVGDIACDPTSPVFDDPEYCHHEDVARLTGRLVKDGAEWFVPLGDLQYEVGGLDAFEQVYDRWFGKFRSITEPVAGNHEWYSEGAAGYFDYFGKRAGSPERPWRTFVPERGWRVVLLDSNCEFVGGCGPSSPQGAWLARVLERSSAPCAIAVWHHPLHSSGGYGGDEATIDRAQPLWDLADAGGVDIVLNGHEHIYERFARIDGMRQFTVGTGGKNFYEIEGAAPKSEVRIGDRYGVLRLTLRDDGRYAYAFVDIDDKVRDSGTSRCSNDASNDAGNDASNDAGNDAGNDG